jgi:hypothetical protein
MFSCSATPAVEEKGCWKFNPTQNHPEILSLAPKSPLQSAVASP